jgi:hypothetical protein
LLAALLRLTIATGGGLLAMQAAGLFGLFLALGLALAAFGLVIAIAVASGAWFPRARVGAAAGVPQPS